MQTATGTLRLQVQDDAVDMIDESGTGYLQVTTTTEGTTEDFSSTAVAAGSQVSVILTESATANISDITVTLQGRSYHLS